MKSSYLKLEEGWLSLLLLILIVQSAVFSVVVASWVDGLGVLPWIAIISILWGLVFSRLRIPGVFLHLVSVLVGVVVIVYLVCSTLPDAPLEDRIGELVERLTNWISVTTSGGIGNDNLLFLLLLCGITWIIGYFGAWSVFHSHSGWVVSLAAGAALIINISYAPHLSSFFIVFLVSAILLVARLNFFRLESSWRKVDAAYSSDLGWVLVRTSFLITGLIVALAWLTPNSVLVNQPMPEVFAQLARPWDELQGEFNRLFGGVRPKGQNVASNFGKTLPLKTGVKLGGEVVLQVSGTEPRRLRGVVYERYTGQGWLVAERPNYRIPADSERPYLAPEFKLREEITQTVTVVQPRGDVVFTPSIPKRLSIPATADMELRPSFTLNVEEVNDSSSADLQNVTRQIKDVVAQQKLSYPPGSSETEVAQAAVAAISNQLDSSFELLGLKMREGNVTAMTLRPIDAEFADVTVLRNPSVARKGFRYTVVSSVSIADAESLRKAGDNYPDWIKSRYLSIPRTVSWRTIALARQITRPYNNQYDALLAIEAYLREFSYSDQVNLPPSARDAVDYFLFEGKEGYCDYFASAFVIMARARGIPARVVSGYAPGDVDPQQGITIVRDWHAHSWPEVYFPDYGWIEFEPTPSRPVVSRPEVPREDTRDEVAGTSSDGNENLEGDVGEGDTGNDVVDGDSFLAESRNGYDIGALIGSLAQVFLPALVVVILVYLILLYFWQRDIARLSPGAAAYAKMCRLARWLGTGRRQHQTPAEFAVVLLSLLPEQKEYVVQITDAYVKCVFGCKHLSLSEERRLAEAWRQVRNALLRARLKWR